jgi:hypothetical protein
MPKSNSVGEQFFQLTITAKNFSERLKNLSTIKISSGTTNPYNCDKVRFLSHLFICILFRILSIGNI